MSQALTSDDCALLLPTPVGGVFDYRNPENFATGQMVQAGFGRQKLVGVVWGAATGQVPPEKLKPVTEPLPWPLWQAGFRAFLDFVADYTLSPPGMVLRMALGGAGALALAVKQTKRTPPPPQPPKTKSAAILSDGQQAVWQQLQQALLPAQVSLLEGVTGSGKTEVYAKAIEQILAKGQQVLLLVPEIALTAQLLGRLATQLGVAAYAWHADLTPAQRRTTWQHIVSGQARLVVGARSALFLPYQQLGLIVVDEEHEPAYKQEEGVLYHARDMAVARGHYEKIPIVLVSATPAVETIYNVQQKRYRHFVLPQRYGRAVLPQLQLIDLRQNPPPKQAWLSPMVRTAISEVLAQQQQALLFLNRRGYAPLTLCRTCGHRLKCPQCSAWLVEHKAPPKLHCHHCGYQQPSLKACPACASEDSLVACGPGIERVFEEAKKLWPAARIAAVSSDMAGGIKAVQQVIEDLAAGKVDIVVGTQILAKGHNFPSLTLVAVIDADLGLGGGDLRAAERTYQLLQQVGGRAGRAEQPGRVLVQTLNPEHAVLQAIQHQQRADFYASELAERQSFGMPPFTRLASIIISGADAVGTEQFARYLAKQAPRQDHMQLLGPAPAALAQLRSHYRFRLLLKTSRNNRLQAYLREWLKDITVPRAFKLQIDIDPHNFL